MILVSIPVVKMRRKKRRKYQKNTDHSSGIIKSKTLKPFLYPNKY